MYTFVYQQAVSNIQMLAHSQQYKHQEKCEIYSKLILRTPEPHH